MSTDGARRRFTSTLACAAALLALLAVAPAWSAPDPAPAAPDDDAQALEVEIELTQPAVITDWRAHLHQRVFESSLGWIIPSAIFTGMGRATMVIDASYQLQFLAPAGLIFMGVTGFTVLGSELALLTIDRRIDLADDPWELAEDLAASGWGAFGLAWLSMGIGFGSLIGGFVNGVLAVHSVASFVGFFPLLGVAITCWAAAGEAERAGIESIAERPPAPPRFRVVSASPLGLVAVW